MLSVILRKESRAAKLIFFGIFVFTLILLAAPAARGLTVTSAILEINADDEFYAYINGALVFDTQSIPGTDWEHTFTVDVSDYMFCGDFVLAFNYYDTLSSIMQISYKLTMTLDDATTRIIYSDGAGEKMMINGNYLNSTQVFPAGWNNIGYDDLGWIDPVYICAGTRITDTAFAGGYVPGIGPFSGCGVPEAGQSTLVRETFNILCPLVEITKSISKNIVSLGETITYCFNYSNTDSVAWNFNLWDTIPAVTDFVGCDNGCTTQTYGSDVVVSWPIAATAGGTGTVCVWVAANRYPMLQDYRGLCVMARFGGAGVEQVVAGILP